MPAHALAGFGLQLLVNLDTLHIDLGAVVVAVKERAVAGGHPGGSGSQLVLFDQHDILPTVLGQVIGNAHTDGTTADNDHSCLCFHDDMPPLRDRMVEILLIGYPGCA
jgi:hypothetical protein